MYMYMFILQENWKYPEYPLARIKKIMRMDEDVQVQVHCCSYLYNNVPSF